MASTDGYSARINGAAVKRTTAADARRRVMTVACVVLAAAINPVARADDEQDVRESVVKIFASQSLPNMFRPWEVDPPIDITGSGVVIEGGRILTNAHVVEYALQLYIQPYNTSEKLDATVEFLADDIDLATVKLDDAEWAKRLKPLPLAEALPKMKAKINVMGYPEGGDSLSVTEGVVSRIEFDEYYYETSALRIQVDAAINPGNSGGPGIVDNKVAGLVFSLLQESENIGYLIPAEVIRHFLDDCAEDGYQGYPFLDLNMATVENPALRKFLKLGDDMSGTVVSRVNQPDLKNLIQRGDVVLECQGQNVDNVGLIDLGDGVRVRWQYLVAREEPGATVRLALARDGKRIEIEVPSATSRNTLVQRMKDRTPSYFMYGGLVFTPVTTELTMDIEAGWYVFLGSYGRMLIARLTAYRDAPDEELVVLCGPILPHKLTKGYGVTPLSVVTHVNDQPVRSLRHLVQCVKDCTGPFVAFRFENDIEERVVIDTELAKKYESQIMASNRVPHACSKDLRDIWP